MRVIDFKKNAEKKISKSEVAEMIKKMRKEDEKMVKGRFEFVEAEGGYFPFNHRIYPGDPIRTIELIHGEICEIPMGIVKALNNTKKIIRRYKDVEQTNSGPLKMPKTYDTVSRVRFIPCEYI